MNDPRLVFSDEDLKRLKELLDKGDFQTIEVYEADWIWKRFKALLARLNAAENVCEILSDQLRAEDQFYEHAELSAWRERCGK